MGEEMKGPDRRVIRLCVSGPSLLELVRSLREEPGTVRCTTGLPKDAKVVGMKGRDFRCDVLDLFIESEEFSPVPDGADVPEKRLWFERVEAEKVGDGPVDWELSRQLLLHAKAPSTEDSGVTLAIIISLLEARGIVVKPWDHELQHEAATLDVGEFLDRAAAEPEPPPEGVDPTDVGYWAKLAKAEGPAPVGVKVAEPVALVEKGGSACDSCQVDCQILCQLEFQTEVVHGGDSPRPEPGEEPPCLNSCEVPCVQPNAGTLPDVGEGGG